MISSNWSVGCWWCWYWWDVGGLVVALNYIYTTEVIMGAGGIRKWFHGWVQGVFIRTYSFENSCWPRKEVYISLTTSMSPAFGLNYAHLFHCVDIIPGRHLPNTWCLSLFQLYRLPPVHFQTPHRVRCAQEQRHRSPPVCDLESMWSLVCQSVISSRVVRNSLWPRLVINCFLCRASCEWEVADNSWQLWCTGKRVTKEFAICVRTEEGAQLRLRWPPGQRNQTKPGGSLGSGS